MSYTKTTWKDQNVEKPRTYSVRDNSDGTVTLLDSFGTVTELGTSVNAENMNKIENGIAANDTAIAKEISDRTTAISQEVSARQQADSQLQTAINTKQNILTFDKTPTAGSNNPVTSQGIKTAIDAKDSLPAQSGQRGKFLTTNGSVASWATVDMSSKANTSLNNLTAAGNSVIDGRIINIMESRHQVVDALPTNPDPDTFYYIPE